MSWETGRDWERIRRDYAASSISLRALAEKEGISLSTLQKRSRREGWQQLRKQQQLELGSARLEQVADKLLGSISRALDQGENLEARDFKALSSAVKELGEIKEQLCSAGIKGGRETLEVRLAPELEELSG